MYLIFDAKNGILQLSSLCPSDELISRGICFLNKEFSSNVIIINFKLDFSKKEYIPDYRLEIKNKLFLFFIKNFLIKNRIIIEFLSRVKFFNAAKIIFCSVNICLILGKFFICEIYNIRIEYNELKYKELFHYVLEYKGKEIIFGNTSSLIYTELNQFQYAKNLKFIKLRSFYPLSNSKLSRKILITHYKKIFLMNEKNNSILPFYTCDNLNGRFYLYDINLEQKNEIIIFNDIDNTEKKYNLTIFTYDDYSSYKFENFCRINL
nr:hypothetical protein GTC16762_15000 [Pigmentibacter ruber]